MIPNQTGVQAVVSGNMETAQAKIKMSSHMVDLLSSRVYTDKISAVIRELSCNACDAQVAANVTTPIEVHLPTRFEPYFEVKDNGTGLCHEDVMDLYVTYGASTKQESNDAVGFMGIGSKSPFSYVDAFTTTSNFKGVKRVYSVYKNKGIPEVVLLSTEDTTESNGLAVKVSVKEGDIYNFEVSARKIYFFFNVAPTCNFTLDSLKDKIDIDTSEFSTYPNDYSSEIKAVMGQVAYAVPDSDSLRKLQTLVKKRNLVIKFNIGEVQPAASREHLSNDENTSKNLEAKLDRIYTVYKQEILDKSQEFDTVREAYAYLTNALGSNKANLELNYGGKSYEDWNKSIETAIDSINNTFTGTMYERDSGWGSKSCNMNTVIYAPSLILGSHTNNISFLIKDLKSGGVGAYKSAMPKGTSGFVVDNRKEAEDICKQLIFNVNSVTFYKASEIHKPIKSVKSNPVIKVIKKQEGGRAYTSTLEIDLKSINKIAVYVSANRNGYNDHNGNYHSNLHDVFSLVTAGIYSSIFVVPKSVLKKIHNVNLRELSPKLTESKVTKAMIRNKALGRFNTYKLDKELYRVFSSSEEITPQYKRVNREASIRYDRTLDVQCDRIMEFVTFHSKTQKLINRVCGYTGNLASVKDKLTNKYKFLENFSTTDTESIKYVKCLVKAQDSGEFNT